jgi:hypothetical protein
MLICLLLAFVLALRAGPDGSPDTGAPGPGNTSGGEGDDTGKIVSLDDAAAEPDPEAKPVADPARSEASKVYGGKYNTVEDLERAYLSAEQKITELSTRPAPVPDAPPADEWVDLSDEQLSTLKDTDPDAHAWYVSEAQNRKIQVAIDERLKPVMDMVQPITDLQQKEVVKEFNLNEETIYLQTKKEFGPDFDALDRQRQSPEMIQKVLAVTPQPLVQAILAHHEKGSPAYAQQLLLGAIQTYNMRISRQKAGRSISPDPGSGGGGGRPKEFAASLDEAGDLAAAELGIK